MMLTVLISRLIILGFGFLLPAYKSYKALKTKDSKEHVKWMMYWVVFALFTAVETFADVLLSWLPFYYEVKILFIFWLLSPATKGSSFLYRKFVHPQLQMREKDIDDALNRASAQGYSTIVNFGAKGLNFAANTVVTTAFKGHSLLSDQLRQRSASLSDLHQTGKIEGEEDPAAGDTVRRREGRPPVAPLRSEYGPGRSGDATQTLTPTQRRRDAANPNLYKVSERDEDGEGEPADSADPHTRRTNVTRRRGAKLPRPQSTYT